MVKLVSFLPFILATKLTGSAAFSLSPSVRLPPPIRAHTNTIATKNHRSVGPLMSSTATDEEETPSDGDKKIEGRKNRVIIGYKAMMISYIAVGIAPVATAGLSFPVFLVLAGFVTMPAGVSYIMISAAKNDRLSSDTYKRLNLALFQIGAVGLGVVALGWNKRRNAMLALTFVLSVINSTKGYAYGVLGWDKQSSETTLLRDLTRVIKDTARGFFSMPKTINSCVYQVATALVASLKLLKLFEIVKYIQANSVTAGLSPLLNRFNRLAFFTLVLYTLKDAADRDRLGGTTFILLNYLCALSMGVNYAFYSGMPKIMGALSAGFAAFFAFNGISSYMKNKNA